MSASPFWIDIYEERRVKMSEIEQYKVIKEKKCQGSIYMKNEIVILDSQKQCKKT